MENMPEYKEQVPSLESIKDFFNKLINDREFVEGRFGEDDKGIYLREVSVKTDDGSIGYEYMRKGRYTEGQASETAIHAVYYDNDGDPCGGELAAKFIDGEWNPHSS